jgi:hypothetical protein
MGKTNYGFYLIGGGLAFVVGALSYIFIIAPADGSWEFGRPKTDDVFTYIPDKDKNIYERLKLKELPGEHFSDSNWSKTSSTSSVGGGSRHYRKSRKGRKSHNKKSKKRSKL